MSGVDEHQGDDQVHQDHHDNDGQFHSGSGGQGYDDDDDPTRQVRNLIVNYIPNAIDESGLRGLFAPIGPIESVKIVVDKGTGVSLGYGFVVFENAVDAERAVEALNGHEIASKKLKVGYAHAGRKDNSHLYVAGLDKALTKDDVVKHFSVYGVVEEVKILREPGTTVSRGVAFVHFSNRREAEAAMNSLNEQTLPGSSNVLSVKFADQKKKHGAGGGGGRSPMWGMAPQSMYNPGIYSPYPISPAFPLQGYRPQQQQQGLHQGYGESSDSTLFVFNLPPACDEPLLFSLFSPFGQVASVKVVRDPSTRMCKGFGFVSYARRDEAMLAVSQLNGSSLYGKVLQVSFKKSSSGQHHGNDMMGGY